jgi:hypothetical protein
VFAAMLRSEEVARRFGLLAGRVASRLLALGRRPPVHGWELATVKFRTRTIDLVEHRWVAITATSLLSHLSLYAVLLVALRHIGVSDAEVGWAEVLAVFAFARLATAIPITPAGRGGRGGADRRAGGRRWRQAPGGRGRAGLPGPHLAAAGPGGRRLLSVVAAAVVGGADRPGAERRRGRGAAMTEVGTNRSPRQGWMAGVFEGGEASSDPRRPGGRRPSRNAAAWNWRVVDARC